MQDDVRIIHEDCRSAIIDMLLDDVQVDSVVTDPPYALTSIVKRFGAAGSAPAKFGSDGRFTRASAGFMGKKWDTGDVAHDPAFWRLVLDVMKPGAHLVAFGGTRTYHRLACAIEDAGFEVRDTIAWLYGQGFPKSHDAGDGWGTALKPAMEPIVVARKPLIGTVAANVLAHGTGAINIDGCRVDVEGAGRPLRTSNRSNGNQVYGEGLHGSLAVGETSVGRWPANVIHDGSAEVLDCFPDAPGQLADLKGHKTARSSPNGIFGDFGPAADRLKRGDSGSAARFFYTAKASKADRAGSKHPTVKPLALMRYLCRLVTPPGGTVLDPFAGSGTTLQAALEEGFRCIGIEREDEYHADIQARMAAVQKRLLDEVLA